MLQIVDGFIISGIGVLFLVWILSSINATIAHVVIDKVKRHQTLVGSVVLLLLTGIAYQKMFFAYFQGDDFVILEDYLTKPHAFSQLRYWLTSGSGLFYRPLVSIIFAIDFLLWGANSAGYHFTNILFHCLNSLLVLFIARRLLRNTLMGYAVALLFAVHPVHVESVAWISGRFDIFCGFFFLAAIALYIQYRQGEKSTWLEAKGFYLFSLLCFVFALLSKEMAVTLPFIIVLVEICYLKESQKLSPSGLRELTASFEIYLPYFLLLGFYAIWRTYALGGLGGYAGANGSVHSQFPMEIVLTSFIDKLNRLTIPIFSFHPYHILSFLALFLLLIILLRTSLQFALLWIVITFLPVINMVMEGGVHDILAERYLYIPSVGACFFIVGFLELLQDAQRRMYRFKRIAGSLLILGIALYYFNYTRYEVNIWRTASDIARNIPLEVKEQYPNITRTHFYFENIPDNLQGAYIYRLGLGAAMKLVYDLYEEDRGERVYTYQLDDCSVVKRDELGKTAFCFRYENGHVFDKTNETIFALDLAAHQLPKQDYLLEDTIEFQSAASAKFLYTGWHPQENWGVWGNSKESVILFSLSEQRTYELDMIIRALELGQEPQIVQFYLNDIFLKQVELPDDSWQTVRLTLPEAALSGNVEQLSIHSKYVNSPASLKMGPDSRPISIGLGEIILY